MFFRFALDRSEQNKPESEDEIHEHVESTQSDDTDDEWTHIPERFLDFYLFLCCLKTYVALI